MTPDRSSHSLLTASRAAVRLANMTLWQAAVAFVVYLGLSASLPTVDTRPVEPSPAACAADPCVIHLDYQSSR
jgi:hypothetical protein